jgi:hypothetical protein
MWLQLTGTESEKPRANIAIAVPPWSNRHKHILGSVGGSTQNVSVIAVITASHSPADSFPWLSSSCSPQLASHDSWLPKIKTYDQ